MIINLDMENAFDRVLHSSLFDVKKKLGFNEYFINWIATCIGNRWITPLIKECSYSFFQASKGLRQGFPLSPPLYILVAKSLSRNLALAMVEGKQKGLSIAPIQKMSTIPNSSDETILLGCTSKKIAMRFKHTFNFYLNFSGGLINKGKSQFFGWRCSISTLQEI